jgi:hypothetical protein
MTTIATTIPAIIELIDTPIKAPVNVVATVNKVSKPKGEKPLAAKHMKNMVFGYWIAMKMKADGLITEEGYKAVMTEYLAVYGKVSAQTTHYEQFVSDTKVTTKELKKLIKDHHKPPKVKKEKVKKDPAAKKGRKAQDKEPKDDLVAKIVAASYTANTDSKPAAIVLETEIETEIKTEIKIDTKPSPKPKRKYIRKKKAEIAVVIAPCTQTQPATVAATAASTVTSEIELTSPPQLIRNEPEHICNCDELHEEEMEDTEVTIFTLPNGDKCYKDEQNNLYDFTTREPL